MSVGRDGWLGGQRRRRGGSGVAAALALVAAGQLVVAHRGSLCVASWGPSARSRSLPAARLREVLAARPLAAMAAAGGGGAGAALEVGCKVRAKSPDDSRWYPGRISDAAGSSWVVAWDDPDGGPETDTLPAEAIQRRTFCRDYAVGDDCRAISQDDGLWYPGTVAAVLGQEKFRVRWDDPDGGDEHADVHCESMKLVKTKRDYRTGDEVFAKFPDDGLMYPGTVLKRNTDGTFQVRWDDPDGGPEESVVSAKDMKVPPIPYDKLKVGQVYTGTVTGVEEFGAFVDVGADRVGLMHVSDILIGGVDDIHTLLEVDQEVKVWICALDDGGKFRLTMIRGRRYGQGGRRFTDLRAIAREIYDEWLDGEVVRVAPYGAFVDVKLDSGDKIHGFVHVSQMSETFVEDINDVVEIGQVVRLRLVDVRGNGDQLSFSMRSSVVPNPALQTMVAPDFGPFLKIDQSTWLKGTVKWLSPKGAFIELTAPGDNATAMGIVPTSEFKGGKPVGNTISELRVDRTVKVRVVSVDIEKNFMDLSMRPWRGSS